MACGGALGWQFSASNQEYHFTNIDPCNCDILPWVIAILLWVPNGQNEKKICRLVIIEIDKDSMEYKVRRTEVRIKSVASMKKFFAWQLLDLKQCRRR